MTAERILQILIASMAVLAASLMGIGQESLWMPGAMLLAAVTSLVFTDLLGWLVLHRVVVNVVAIGAMAVTLMDFWQTDSTGQLLEIAYLLICWQIVMLFQRKSPRVYWCLAVLSLLQVVVASVLHVSVQFGVVLSLYIVVGLFALALFFVHREVLRAAASSAEPFGGPPFPSEGWRKAAVLRIRTRSPSPVASGADETTAELLLGGPPVMRQAIRPEAVRRQLLTRPFLGHIGGICVLTILFAGVFFYAAPRLGNSPWKSMASRQLQEVGFTQEVVLNEIGRIQQSNDIVMRVSFSESETDPETGKEPVFRIYGEPYFHGITLSNYETDLGKTRWRPFRFRKSKALPRAPRGRQDGRQDIVHQTFFLEPVSERTLFSVFPAWRVRGTASEIRQDSRSRRIFRSKVPEPIYQQRPYRYTLGTSGFRDGMQSPMIPHPTGELDAFTRRRLLRIDRKRFPVLIRKARQVVKNSGTTGNVLLKARVLQNHLLNTDLYTYTLNFKDIENQRPPSVDPIEDFIARHRRGHCEYFASALVMMLRDQGIPARMVVGYLGGEYNTLGGYYQVRQSHAHAWVEAYLSPEDIEEEAQTSNIHSANIPNGSGAWVRLDPTPGAGNELVQSSKGLLARLDQVLDYADVLWNQYVMDMSPEEQQRTIYDPLANQAKWTWFHLRQLQKLQQQLDHAARSAVGELQSLVRGGFSIAGGLVLTGTVTLFLALLYGLRRIASWGIRMGAGFGLRTPRAPSTAVLFYLKLEKLLHRIDLKRRPAQTQREFAQQASATLEAADGTAEVAAVPLLVAESFYRVRYGGHSLDKREAESIEHALTELELALKTRPRAAGNGHPRGTTGIAR